MVVDAFFFVLRFLFSLKRNKKSDVQRNVEPNTAKFVTAKIELRSA